MDTWTTEKLADLLGRILNNEAASKIVAEGLNGRDIVTFGVDDLQSLFSIGKWKAMSIRSQIEEAVSAGIQVSVDEPARKRAKVVQNYSSPSEIEFAFTPATTQVTTAQLSQPIDATTQNRNPPLPLPQSALPATQNNVAAPSFSHSNRIITGATFATVDDIKKAMGTAGKCAILNCRAKNRKCWICTHHAAVSCAFRVQAVFDKEEKCWKIYNDPVIEHT